jgi:hypothetical protein
MLVSWNGERAKHATHRNSRNSSKSLLQINHYRNHFSKLFLRRNLFHPTSDLDTPASNSGLIPATSTCVVARTVAISATANRSFNKKSEPPVLHQVIQRSQGTIKFAYFSCQPLLATLQGIKASLAQRLDLLCLQIQVQLPVKSRRPLSITVMQFVRLKVIVLL